MIMHKDADVISLQMALLSIIEDRSISLNERLLKIADYLNLKIRKRKDHDPYDQLCYFILTQVENQLIFSRLDECREN